MERDKDAARDSIKTIKGDAHDALDEAKQRVLAGGEKMKRAAMGDEMPLGDRIASHVKETGHEFKAEVDKTKRDLRDKEG
jgi:hypothetical protein